MRGRAKKDKLKIAFFGIMGHGKSSTANIFAGTDY